MTTWLNDLGIVSALGTTKEAHLEVLAKEIQQSPLCQSNDLDLQGEPQFIGLVKALPLSSKGRVKHILDFALAQIQTTVDKALQICPPERIAVVLGTSTADVYDGERARTVLADTGQWPDDYHYHQQALDAPATYIKEKLALAGPCYSISTACSSSAKALHSAQNLIKAGFADVVIAGGADALCQLTVNGFKALASTSEQVCQPFSAARQGINIGEGAGLFVVSKYPQLSEHQCALLGCGMSSDAYHMSAPQPDGIGAIAAMREALASAGITAQQLDYINAHGTATPKNDEMEAKAIYSLVKDSVPVSSSKHLTGHTLGAAGAIEAGLCWLLIEQQRLGSAALCAPYNESLRDPELADIALIQQGKPLAAKVCLSNSFAFGGNNASIILGEADEE